MKNKGTPTCPPNYITKINSSLYIHSICLMLYKLVKVYSVEHSQNERLDSAFASSQAPYCENVPGPFVTTI